MDCAAGLARLRWRGVIAGARDGLVSGACVGLASGVDLAPAGELLCVGWCCLVLAGRRLRG